MRPGEGEQERQRGAFLGVDLILDSLDQRLLWHIH